jgi:hypothetical protein
MIMTRIIHFDLEYLFLKARDFSLMIQSVGMVAAASSIILTKTQVEWLCIKYTIIGQSLE